MKKGWEAPRVLVQEFVPNEYVAACYKIQCTTPNGNSTYYYLYDDTNDNGEWDSEDKELYSNPLSLLGGGFSGCNKWHKGVIIDAPPTANGFVTKGKYPESSWGSKPAHAAVYWWNESLGSSTDYHCMTPGKENYQTNPNAS